MLEYVLFENLLLLLNKSFVQRVLQCRQSGIPNLVVRLQSDATGGGKSNDHCRFNFNEFNLDRPWDKSTRAVVYELPDVNSPAGLFDR